MPNYKGVIVSIVVSLFGVPMVIAALCHPVMSQLLPMYVFNYSLLLTAAVFIVAALPPNFACLKTTRRNEVYYMACIFMCLCTGSGAAQAWRLRIIPHQPNVKVGYFQCDEPYMNTPFGMSTVIWNDCVNYIIYVVLVYMIDNGMEYRNLALYWCGGTLTSEFVATLGSFIGCHSHQLHYTEIKHFAVTLGTAWVLYKFLVRNPRTSCDIKLYNTRFKTLDTLITVLFTFYSFFNILRGLGGLGGRQKIVAYYIGHYEPYIIHPSRFGAVWVIYVAAYGIPFQLATIKGLKKPGSEWLINSSILYASSLLQGTTVFLSYSFYPRADRQYKIPPNSFMIVLLLNIAYVVLAHALMYRCLSEPGYFIFRKEHSTKTTCSPSRCSIR